jgi:two-component system response regulator NreC
MSARPIEDAAQSYRIVVVDDHAIMRDGLSALLDKEEEFEVVGTASDGKTAIEVVDRLAPDIVIMDLSMPRTDGARAIAAIKRKHEDLKIVVLTFHKEEAHIRTALEAGADAYVLKDNGREELLAAINNVAAGRNYLSPVIAGRVMSGYVRAGAPAAPASSPSWQLLTPREREILVLVAEGYKSREIAEYLSLSVRTIETHRASLMRKLDLNSVSAVTAYAIANGLLVQ